MLDTGTDAERGNQGFPHGIGGADDVISMPLQASTQWDGLGHIFDHGNAWNGRRAGDVVTSEGDKVTGIETVGGLIAGRGVLLDVGRAIGTDGELPDGFAITTEHLEATIAAQGESARVGRGDLLLVRTGGLARARREGWGDYAGGLPGLSFTTADWLHGTEIAGIATDTWGFEVRPNEFDIAFQPLHQVAIPNIGLFLGEMWDLDALAADCAADGVYDFWLTAAPLPVTGAVAHRSTRSPSSRVLQMPAVNNVLVVGSGLAGAATAIHLAQAGVVDLIEIKPDVAALGRASPCRATRCALKALGVWDQVQAKGYAFDTTGIRAPDPNGTVVAEIADAKTGGPTCPPSWDAPAGAGPDPGRPGGRGRRQGPVRHDVHRAHPGRRRRRRHRRRFDRPLRPRRRRRRRPVLDPPRARHQPGDQVGRHGHLARVRAPPASVTRTDLYYGGPSYIAGYCPTGEDSLYAYIVEDAQDRSGLSPEEQLATMKQLSRAYHGPWDEIRETLTDPPGSTTPGSRPTSSTRPGTAAGSCSSATPRTPARPPSPRAARWPWRTPSSSPSCSWTPTRSTRTCGTPSTPAGSSARRPSSTPPTSSPSGSSTTSRATSRA